jgi:hypothetical protein
MKHRQPFPLEHTMNRMLPLIWTAVHLCVAGAATFILCSTNLLGGMTVVFH